MRPSVATKLAASLRASTSTLSLPEVLPLEADTPPEVAPAAAQLNSGLNFVLRSNPDQRTIALGARWDVRSGVALKAQVDFMDLLSDSHGTFRNLQPTFQPGGSVQLASVAATFVF